MKKLYLASEIDKVASHIADDIGSPSEKKLAFIYTSYEYVDKEPDWLKENRQGLVDAGFDLFDYTITGKNTKDFDEDLGKIDIIHVNGGDSFYLLLQSQKTGFDKWIKSAVEKGKIYTGSSAGCSIAAPNIKIKAKEVSDRTIKKLKNLNGYGIVDFMIMPHWGRADFKELYRGRRFDLSYNTDNKLIFLNDKQYVKVIDDMYKIVDIRDK